MPTYLHKLLKMQAEGRVNVSSTELAEYMDVELIVVRKDIALTGVSGQRRIGYNIDELIRYIKLFLGWEVSATATLIGAGSLGAALLGYDDIVYYGFDIRTVFDADPGKIGTVLRGKMVYDVAELERRLQGNLPEIAVLCVPKEAAQGILDRLAALGIRYFWSFANTALKVPEGVVVEREVLAGGLARLGVRRKLDRQARRKAAK